MGTSQSTPQKIDVNLQISIVDKSNKTTATSSEANIVPTFASAAFQSTYEKVESGSFIRGEISPAEIVIETIAESNNNYFECCGGEGHRHLKTTLTTEVPPLPPSASEIYPPYSSLIMSETVSVAVVIISSPNYPPFVDNVNKIKENINAALSFFVNKGGVTFQPSYYVIESSAPGGLPMPINPPNTLAYFETLEQPWRDAAFANLVFVSAGTAAVRCADLTNKTIASNNTKWGFTIFVTNYPCAKYCYSLGASNTRMVVQYNRYVTDATTPGGPVGPVLSPYPLILEICRMFGVKSETTSSAAVCTGSGWYNVPNYNAALCPNTTAAQKVPCYIKDADTNSSTDICYFSNGQLGWPAYSNPVVVADKPATAVDTFKCSGGMASVEFQGKLYVFYAKPASDPKYPLLMYCSSAQPDVANTWSVPSGIGTSNLYGGCSAVVFNNILYVFYMIYNNKNVFYVSKASESAVWSSPVAVSGVIALPGSKFSVLFNPFTASGGAASTQLCLFYRKDFGSPFGAPYIYMAVGTWMPGTANLYWDLGNNNYVNGITCPDSFMVTKYSGRVVLFYRSTANLLLMTKFVGTGSLTTSTGSWQAPENVKGTTSGVNQTTTGNFSLAISLNPNTLHLFNNGTGNPVGLLTTTTPNWDYWSSPGIVSPITLVKNGSGVVTSAANLPTALQTNVCSAYFQNKLIVIYCNLSTGTPAYGLNCIVGRGV